MQRTTNEDIHCKILERSVSSIWLAMANLFVSIDTNLQIFKSAIRAISFDETLLRTNNNFFYNINGFKAKNYARPRKIVVR